MSDRGRGTSIDRGVSILALLVAFLSLWFSVNGERARNEANARTLADQVTLATDYATDPGGKGDTVRIRVTNYGRFPVTGVDVYLHAPPGPGQDPALLHVPQPDIPPCNQAIFSVPAPAWEASVRFIDAKGVTWLRLESAPPVAVDPSVPTPDDAVIRTGISVSRQQTQGCVPIG